MGKGNKKNDEHNERFNNALSEDTKPLPKLVLKVGKERGEQGSQQDPNHSLSNDDVHNSRKKKKKHKHKSNDPEKKAKKREINVESNQEEPSNLVAPPKKRSKEAAKKPKIPEYSAFQLCLENLHKNLQRKDVYSIFSLPVTDFIAPGYSTIIKNPMDFLTMQKKIAHNEYNSLDEFRDDFELMCNNAMIYNGSDTIYYKSAEKMLALGIKLLSKGKVKKMSKALGIDYVDVESVDNDMNSLEEKTISTYDIKSEGTAKKKTKARQTKEDREAIISSILLAAENAKQKLSQEKPKQLYGFVSKDEEGNFSYNILNRDRAREKRDINFDTNLNNINEEDEKKKRMAAIQQLWYGPFGSFGPTQDIALSKLTKDESDLLLKTYGTELGVTYARSITKFAENSEYATSYVDRLLDIVTNGAHTATYKPKEIPVSNPNVPTVDNAATVRKEETEAKDVDFAIEVDMKSLKSLSDIGIDISFLNDFNEQSHQAGTAAENL